jgi:DNA-binding CsgD family transcriptional regulator
LAAAATTASPTPVRVRRLEVWRGVLCARRGDGDGLVTHLERAANLAAEHGRAAARCEALATLAVEAARLGRTRKDVQLLEQAERVADETLALAAGLTGHPPWPMLAHAALADVALARGDATRSLTAARAAAEALSAGEHKTIRPEVVRPMAEALAASPEVQERDAAVVSAQTIVGLVAERITDESILLRWCAAPDQSRLIELAGGVEAAREAVRATPGALVMERLPKLPLTLEDDDLPLVRLMMEGQTDSEIAARLGTDEQTVQRRLSDVLTRMGAPSRSAATLYAFMAGVI